MNDNDKVSKLWLQTKRLPFLQEKFNRLTVEVDALYAEMFKGDIYQDDSILRERIAAKHRELSIVTGQLVEVRYLSEGGFTI